MSAELISIADYHAAQAISPSKLKHFADNEHTPERYAAKFITRTTPDERPSEARIIGQMAEDLIQRGAIGDTYVAKKFDAFRTAEAKAWRDEIEASGRIIYDADQLAAANRCRDAFMRNPLAAKIQEVGQQQATFRVSMRGVIIQCRPDYWLPEGLDGMSNPLIPDLKTCEDVNDFDGDVFKFKYHWQAYLNRLIIHQQPKATHGPDVPAPDFWWIAVDKQPTPICIIKRYTEAHEAAARLDLDGIDCSGLLWRLVERYRTGSWSAPVIEDAKSPAWAERLVA